MCGDVGQELSHLHTRGSLALGRFWELKFTPRSITTSAAEHFTRQFSEPRKTSFEGLCKCQCIYEEKL